MFVSEDHQAGMQPVGFYKEVEDHSRSVNTTLLLFHIFDSTDQHVFDLVEHQYISSHNRNISIDF
jgi:hypothetical protein